MKKHVFGLIAVPLITASFTSALALSVFADEEIGNGGVGIIPATCTSLQQEIDDAPAFTRTPIILEEDCQANIVIPANKYIDLWATGLGADPTVSTLTNDEGYTITVQEGAKLILNGGILKNTTAEKAIVKNDGLVVISDSQLVSENNSYTLINSGELNIVDAEIIGFKVSNNENGILRIAHGTVDNEEAAEPYVTGCINCGEIGSGGSAFALPKIIPVGYNETFEFPNPEYMATYGTVIESSDNSVLEITGSTLSGYKITAKKAGVVYATVTNWISAGGDSVIVYNVDTNTPGLINNSVLEYLASYGRGDSNALIQAVNNDESISVNLNIDELDESDIEDGDLEKISSVLGNGVIISYGDIGLTIDSEENGLLEQIHLLGHGGCGTGDESTEPICFFEENPTNVKWSGLKLGKPAEGYERNYYAIRLHDDEVKKIPASVDADGNIVFSSGKFSLYAIAYEDVKIAEDESAIDAPETGIITNTDDSGTTASLIGCIVAGVIVAFTMMPKIKKVFRK